MSERRLRVCDECSKECGQFIYRVVRDRNKSQHASGRELRLMALDQLDFCSMPCLVAHYGDGGLVEVGA